jgi:beta-glucosidase
VACDHWNRYEEDFDLAAGLGTNAHRLSVEWARLEPREGHWDVEALAHYRSVLLALRARGIAPMVTLHHFVNPAWLSEQGGWANPGVVRLFGRYAAFVAAELGDLCRLWCTVNEPAGLAYQAYVQGYWPPQQRSLGAGLKALRHLLLAHAAAYRAIHAAQPGAMVGIPHYMRIFDPANPHSRLDRAVAAIRHKIFNQLVLEALSGGRMALPLGLGGGLEAVRDTYDYLGVDYYFRDRLAFDLSRPGEAFGRALPPEDLEPDAPFWRGEVYAEGLYRICMDLAKYGKPIYITENGFLESGDVRRPGDIVRHLEALWRAIRDGAPVRGYFHWSLMDNWEWAEGYSARFGLIHVDFGTQQRMVKTSGEVYRRVCQANALPESLLREHGIVGVGKSG